MGSFFSKSEQEPKSASAGRFAMAGVISFHKFMQTNALGDLGKAIGDIEQAVSITPDDHPKKPTYLYTLGTFFQSRSEHTGSLSDLEDAIKHLQQALSLTPDGHADKPMYLANLGNSLESRYGHKGLLTDLDDAVKHLQQAISLTSDDHPNKPEYLSNLGISFRSRFARTGSPSDAEDAITHFQQAISLTPDGHATKPGYLNNLGISFQSRFWHTGSLSDLDNTLKHLQQAISLTPDDHADKPMYLSNLGVSFHSRFLHTGSLSDLEGAIKHLQQAIPLTPDGHATKPGCHNNLGNFLQGRFKYSGSLSDVEDAIKHQQQAVSLTPDGHTKKPGRLTNLGVSFQSRFAHTGSLGDLEDAIEHFRQAVSLTPDGHADKPGYFSNLGNSFRSRFQHTNSLSDLDNAIEYLQKAISLTPDGHTTKPGYLNNLGRSFQGRFEHTGSLSDLQDAIKHKQQAISLTPDGHADRPTYLNNLGISLQSWFGHTGSLSDLEDAIKYLQQAVSLTPDGHAGKLGRLIYLGKSFLSRFSRSGLPNDLAEATSNFQLAATSGIGPVLARCQASRQWARLEAQKDPLSTLPAYDQAINLLPQVAWIGDPIALRHSQLTFLGDIPREAAAYALDADRPDLALEWLEQGRSVVWNQLLHLRTPVNELHQAHPDICAEFTRVSNELQGAAIRGHFTNTDSGMSANILEEEIQRHHRLAEQWDSLVKTIRSLPSFQDFLLPKKVLVLKEAASLGPVVVINAHQRRCDALVLERGRDQVLHIPLDRLRYKDLEKMQGSLRQCLANPHRHQRWDNRTGGPTPMRGPHMAQILKQIYLDIVHPILQSLGMTTSTADSSNLPRIWWCPTGPLTFLPLHAACHRTGDKIDGTFNHVVSSYIPTVNALLEARAVKQQPFNQLVGIAMAKTPGQHSLPCVETEMAVIGKLCSDNSRWGFEILRNEQATAKQVLASMANNSWIHLACHGIQDKQEPTRSGFRLHDRRLTITDIISEPFVHADLAFLSACQTATGDEKALDEAVHITGAMLGAGYRNVIGTMWAIPDEVAPRIAAKVYEILLSREEPNSDRAAQALHEAVREVRDSKHDLFTYWVPFVHYGA